MASPVALSCPARYHRSNSVRVPMLMSSRYARPVRPLLLLGCAFGAFAQAPASSPDFFESRIRPVLANHCYSCHTNSQLGGLRLDSREAMLKGGKSGASIAPGDPE